MNQTEIRRRQTGAFAHILMFVTIYVMGRLTGDKGIAYTAVAAEICAVFWIAINGSMSDALGRLLRNRRNKGQYRNMVKMRSSVMLFQLALGALGSLSLAAMSGILADKLFRIPCSRLILLAFAPVVLLRTASAVFTGYFQGEGSEVPGAIAGILRQVFLLGFGLLFGRILGGYGEKVSSLLREENFTAMYSGLGIALAADLAELLVILFLGLIYRGSRRVERRGKQEGMYTVDSLWDSVRYLHNARWPQFVTALCLFLPPLLGLLFCGRNQAGERMTVEYGQYMGKYLVVCGIAGVLISMPLLSVIGKIFQCFKREENRFARTVFQSGVHAGLVHGIFLSVFVAVMGEQFAHLLCGKDVQTMTKMLQGGSALIALAALAWYFCRLLHAMGKKYPVLAAVCGGDILFTAVVLAAIGRAGIMALVYGGLAGAFILCVLSGAFAYRQLRLQPDWLNTIVVPLGAGVGAGLVCLLVRKLLSPHLGSFVTLLVAFVAAGAVYWTALLLLRNFREQELEAIPGGKLIGILGQMLRVF